MHTPESALNWGQPWEYPGSLLEQPISTFRDTPLFASRRRVATKKQRGAFSDYYGRPQVANYALRMIADEGAVRWMTLGLELQFCLLPGVLGTVESTPSPPTSVLPSHEYSLAIGLRAWCRTRTTMISGMLRVRE